MTNQANTSNSLTYFAKRRIALNYYLSGKEFFTASSAMAFAERKHTGHRKDGVTPEFQHMLEIALHITTLRDVIHEEATIAAALLHDVREDCDVSHQELVSLFGSQIADAVEKLSKVLGGTKKTYDSYFKEISECPIASLVKGCDRIHNYQSMPKVFTVEKQVSYLEEGSKWFLPMLKQASQNFPSQMLAYANVRHTMKSQIYLLNHSLEVINK